MGELTTIGHYRRELGASIDRLFENALDWEHLPHLHDSSFSDIAMTEAGGDRWTADAVLVGGMTVSLELRLNRSRGIWVTRTRDHDGIIISEIVTKATPLGTDRCRVDIAFRMTGVSEHRRTGVAAYYRDLYARLYDEDEAMMIARAEALRAGAKGRRERRTVTLADGERAEVPVRCPHWGLPLDAEPDADGIVTCPWHGYRFDVRSGLCVSGQQCSWR